VYRKNKQQGVSLIEALVALVILSIGLLGVLMLQTRGMVASHESIHRQDASILASDLFERMKANKISVTSGSEYIENFATTGLSETAICSTTGCTSTQMAITDIVQWRALLANSLPSSESALCLDLSPNDGTGAGSSGCDSASSGALVIKIWWGEKEDNGSTTTMRYTVAVNNIESI